MGLAVCAVGTGTAAVVQQGRRQWQHGPQQQRPLQVPGPAAGHSAVRVVVWVCALAVTGGRPSCTSVNRQAVAVVVVWVVWVGVCV